MDKVLYLNNGVFHNVNEQTSKWNNVGKSYKYNVRMKKRHKAIYTMWFHLYTVQKQAKSICYIGIREAYLGKEDSG